MNVSSEQPAYFKILRAPRRVSEEALERTAHKRGGGPSNVGFTCARSEVRPARSHAMRMARAREIIGEQAGRRVHVQHVLRRRAGAPPRARRDREGGARPRGCRGGCFRRAAPVLKIALHAYCRRLRRVKGRHLRRRQRQLRTHGAPRVKPWACLTPGRLALSGFGEVLGAWSFRATRSVSSFDITTTIFSGVPTLITWQSAILAPRPQKALPAERPGSSWSLAGGHSLGHAWHGPAHGTSRASVRRVPGGQSRPQPAYPSR